MTYFHFLPPIAYSSMACAAKSGSSPALHPPIYPKRSRPLINKSRHADKVALVLAAGNVACIAVIDLLHKLFTEGQVCLLKMNPINDYLGVFFEDIFSSFCEAGYVQFAYGGADVGAYLCAHPDIDEIHMTGSARTHDAIVYGTGPDAEERKRKDQPVNTKRITSELGCVTPTIVVPGPWSEAELRYHAEHIASQKLTNAGFNCVSAQVLIMSAEWDQASALTRRDPNGPPRRPTTAFLLSRNRPTSPTCTGCS